MTKSSVPETGWFWSALLLLFVGLKLCHVIAWSWWWVLAPAWIPAALLLVCLVILALLGLVVACQGSARPTLPGRWPRG